MAAQLARRDRSIPDPANSPAAAVNEYIAYFGTYEVDPEVATIAHHRLAHVNPEMSLLTAVRHYRFDGDTLTLTVAPDRDLRLNWKRQG
jgi:hypothetical protein